MTIKKQTKIIAVVGLIYGIINMMITFILFTGMNVDMLANGRADFLYTIVEMLKKDLLTQFFMGISGYLMALLSWRILFEKKVQLNMNIVYTVETLVADVDKKIVDIKLRNPATGEIILLKKETPNAKYFKEYIDMNGPTMPGAIAALV